ncbi:hypothetical protein TWF730_008427 [Orbilia blumenaviensis]|uniref:Uncharacterized protein n=1 Tax=Orbilia blumenaviensis TaxID=1796055 RepID=A0AAV9V2A7_9PEZI
MKERAKRADAGALPSEKNIRGQRVVFKIKVVQTEDVDQPFYNTVRDNLFRLFDKTTGWLAGIRPGNKDEDVDSTGEHIIVFTTRESYKAENKSGIQKCMDGLIKLLCNLHGKTSLRAVTGNLKHIQYMPEFDANSTNGGNEISMQRKFNEQLIVHLVRVVAEAGESGDLLKDISDNTKSYLTQNSPTFDASHHLKWVILGSCQFGIYMADFIDTFESVIEMLPLPSRSNSESSELQNSRAQICVDWLIYCAKNTSTIREVCTTIIGHIQFQKTNQPLTQVIEDVKKRIEETDQSLASFSASLTSTTPSAHDNRGAMDLIEQLNQSFKVFREAYQKIEIRKEECSSESTLTRLIRAAALTVVVGIVCVPIGGTLGWGVLLEPIIAAISSGTCFNFVYGDSNELLEVNTYLEGLYGILESLLLLRVFLSFTESQLSGGQQRLGQGDRIHDENAQSMMKILGFDMATNWTNLKCIKDMLKEDIKLLQGKLERLKTLSLSARP